MGGLADLDRPLLRERQRPLLPWIVAAVVALAVVAVAAAFYYSPLTAVGELVCPEQAELVPPVEAEDDPGGPPVCLVPHRAGDTVTFTTVLRNDGPLAVVVHSVAFDGAVGDLLEVVDVAVARDGAPAQPLSRLRLDAGAERRLTVEARLLSCELQREGVVVSMTALPVRTSFLGIAHTADVPLPSEIALLLEDC